MKIALQAAEAVGIPLDKIFVLELPGINNEEASVLSTIETLIAEGSKLPELEPLKWTKGQGARQPAFLCYSSGTSGLPVSIQWFEILLHLTDLQKAVMISHRNIIANVIQQSVYESVGRAHKGVETQTIFAPLPFSHIFALVMICHSATWRGDEVIVTPKYDLKSFLAAIERFKVAQIFVVRPFRPSIAFLIGTNRMERCLPLLFSCCERKILVRSTTSAVFVTCSVVRLRWEKRS